MEIGTRIKEMRKARNITQVQLAQMTGISQSSISAIEKLTNNPSAVTLKLIAAALGCTVGELIGEKKEQETPSRKNQKKFQKNKAPFSGLVLGCFRVF